MVTLPTHIMLNCICNKRRNSVNARAGDKEFVKSSSRESGASAENIMVMSSAKLNRFEILKGVLASGLSGTDFTFFVPGLFWRIFFKSMDTLIQMCPFNVEQYGSELAADGNAHAA